MAFLTCDEFKQKWIKGLAAARKNVLEAVQSLPADCADTVFIGVWSAKDLVAHLIGWDRTNISAIGEILNGVYPSFFQHYDKDWQSYNRALVQRYRKNSVDELIADATASHEELIALLQNLDARVLVNASVRSQRGRTVTVRNLLVSESNDEDDHAREVWAFLKKG
jgi:hypothetical protein